MVYIIWSTTWVQVWKGWGRPRENLFNRNNHQAVTIRHLSISCQRRYNWASVV